MDELLICIENALAALALFRSQNKGYDNNWTTNSIEKVLKLMLAEISKKNSLDVIVLRGTKDIYVVSFRNFDGTTLHDEMNKIYAKLDSLYPDFKKLEPLGMEFYSSLSKVDA